MNDKITRPSGAVRPGGSFGRRLQSPRIEAPTPTPVDARDRAVEPEPETKAFVRKPLLVPQDADNTLFRSNGSPEKVQKVPLLAPEPETTPVPPDETELVRQLGVSFRDESAPAGASGGDFSLRPDEAEIARQLGISFRESLDAAEPAGLDMAAEAARLGISFRDGNDRSSSNRKPATGLSRYLPILLFLAVIVGLLAVAMVVGPTLLDYLTGPGY